jgi:hypothetical protein
MALTLRAPIRKWFKETWSWIGSNNRDVALNWAKTAMVQPQGTTTVAADVLAIPVTHSCVVKTTGADAEALTLANGTTGQVLVITLGTAGGGTGTLTPVTATGWATAAFTVAGDGLSLLYVDDTVGWIVLGSYGATTSTAATVIALS